MPWHGCHVPAAAASFVACFVRLLRVAAFVCRYALLLHAMHLLRFCAFLCCCASVLAVVVAVLLVRLLHDMCLIVLREVRRMVAYV